MGHSINNVKMTLLVKSTAIKNNVELKHARKIKYQLFKVRF